MSEDIDAAAMRIARAWAKQKGGLPIPETAVLDDLEDPDFLRALATAALQSSRAEVEKLREALPQWQTIDTVPANRVVLVSLISHGGKRVTVKAKFIPANTEEAEASLDHAEYNEAMDTYYCPEGWYEDVYAQTGLDCGYIQFDGNPTHWMLLPRPPTETDANQKS